ncbi:hypothetical protein HY487_00075 [Candidatus Woesearchaeota archaeon]|nr:hypothetical protein [Candidatus Woesearchaeota archaeon]
MNPKKKLDILKGSLESGIIDKGEYKRLEEKIEPESEEFEKKIEDRKIEELHNDPEEPKKSEKPLLITIIVIALLFISILAFSIFNKQEPKTLEDLHVLNLKGKLKPGQGYVYKGVYSFVTLDNLWYTQLSSPKGTKVYSLALRYSPKDLTDIIIEGNLNTQLFNNKSEFFVTFNPTGNEFSFIGLAVADFNTHMSKVFEKNPIAACDRNETLPCQNRPIVTCEDKDKLVLYAKEADKFRTYYNENCIVVEGRGLDLVRGVDRVLYNLYGIMEQEEV